MGGDSPASASSLLKSRYVVLRLLDLFERKRIAATWATVGMLFAENRDELCHYLPDVLPTYERGELNPYQELVGTDERDDPLHFAPSLIRPSRAVVLSSPRASVESSGSAER